MLQLCLIARDEARLLPDCLRSVAGVVDRAVVVDTGSSDGTVAVARAAGATVLEHPWTGDFSAARSAGLGALDDGWMLVLDADERLAPGAGPALQAAIAAGGFDAGLLPLHNAARLDAPPAEVLAGRARLGEPVHLARLFRLAPDLRWHGAVHERLDAPGRALRYRLLDAPIVHLGYAADLDGAAAKAARNVSLLQPMADAAGPLDPQPFCYLARDAARAGQPEVARAAALEGWRRLAAGQSAGRPLPLGAVTLASVAVDHRLSEADPDGAADLLDAAAGRGLRHPNLDLLAATVALVRASVARGGVKRRLWKAAEAAADRALSAHGQPQTDEVSAGATSWMAHLRRGESLLLQGRHAAAEAAFAEALAALPRPAPPGLAQEAAVAARVGGAEALLSTRPDAALARVEPALKAPWPDAWVVAAAACRALGQPQEATLFAQQARARRGRGWLAPHRLAMSRR